MKKIRLGVSSCLLGNPVRYDGQHQRSQFICDKLSKYADFIPVCPEVECGLPVPREAMHLIGDPDSPRLVTIRTGQDLTGQMLGCVSARLDQLAAEELDGFIFKKDSPSSGLFRVKIYNLKGVPSRTGRGLFAGAFVNRFPRLPVIEDGMLNDRFLRERFLNRIFTAQRWNERNGVPRTRKWLSDFQSIHKLMLLSHAPGRYAELGRLVESGDADAYRAKLDELLGYIPTVSKHVNVIQHILGYFKKELEPWEKTEVLDALECYRNRRLQIAVPLTLLRHYIRKYHKEYLEKQTYWDILGQLYE